MTDARSNGQLEARPIERNDRTPTRARPRQQADPNFPARRMLVSAGVITLVIVGIAFVWQQFGDDGSTSSTEPATWDAIALVDRGSGDVNVVDPAGEVVARYSELGRVSTVEVAGGRVALIGSTEIVLTHLTGNGTPTVVPVDRGSTVTRLATRLDQLLLAIGNPTGGDVTIVDGITGTSLDIGELAGLDDPLLYVETIRIDPDGTALAIADARSFQTIVVRRPADDADADAEWTVENYAAIPVALGDGLVATSQVVGQRADIALHHPDGRSSPVSAGLPAGGVIHGDQLVVVTTEGTIERISRGGDEARRLGELDLPDGAVVSSVHPALDGQRLVVVAEQYIAVVDLDGNVLYPSEDSIEAPELAAAPLWGWRCVALTPPAARSGAAIIVSLTDGALLVDQPDDEVLGTSADGCTVLTRSGDEIRVLADDRRAELGAATAAQVAPDGRAAVVRRDGGTVELVTLDGSFEPQPPVDLTAALPSPRADVVFLER